MDVTHWNISDRRCLLRKMCSSCFIFLLQEPHTHSLFWMRVCGRRFTVAFPFHIPERQWQNNGMAATTQVDKTFPFVVLNVGHTCYYDDYCPRIFGPSQHLGCCFSSFAPAEGGPFVWLEMRRIFPLKEWVDDLTLSPSKKKTVLPSFWAAEENASDSVRKPERIPWAYFRIWNASYWTDAFSSMSIGQLLSAIPSKTKKTIQVSTG